MFEVYYCLVVDDDDVVVGFVEVFEAPIEGGCVGLYRDWVLV